MAQTRPKKQITPLNADSFNLIPDWAATADTSGVIVSVANQAEGDTIATALSTAGYPVTDARPLYCWDLSQNTLIVRGTSGWRGGIKPFGHMGVSNGAFQALGTTPAKVAMTAAQRLRGGVTFDDANDSLVVPLAGDYRLTAQYYTTGAGSGTQLGFIYANTTQLGITTRQTKLANEDCQSTCTGVYTLAAGDKVSLYGITTSGVTSWGSTGYNGDFIEVEYLDQW